MKLIIAGSRNYHDCVVYELIHTTISKLNETNQVKELVTGCAKGVDAFAEKYGRRYNIPIVKFPADWEKYGKAAGPIRNKQMAIYADALLLIWDGESRGSANMLKNAKEQGLKIFNVVIEI